ncbi:spore germination protein [Peribacillus saganii]|uniref:Spore germination protein n=1 Tax=Peribacillus saganii TaxID=2303992 RepID=A0A372LJ20_9BACI|nr:spore germination protein [Peribacillus saganii]RFU66397.1 spore germination protein [Peribacillus saganii]
MRRKIFKRILKKIKTPTPNPPEVSSHGDIALKKQNIKETLDQNLKIFKYLYTVPDNVDVKIREITIPSLNRNAAILYIASISDVIDIEERILHPLLHHSDGSGKIENIVSAQTLKTAQKIEDIVNEVNGGVTALFVDGDRQCYLMEMQNFQSRSIGMAENEVVLKGPKESFTEKAIINISLVRKLIRDENLVAERTVISKRSNNGLFMLYVKDLVNDELLNEVKSRISKLDLAAVHSISFVEQLIEERKSSLFPTVLYTERPDRASAFLEEGHIVLMLDSSPACLIVPTTFWAHFHNPEEHYLRYPYGNFTRLLRFLALFIALFISPLYVAIANYHSGMIPPDLLLAIAATREKVPFPAIIEIIMMEFAFELIREAGLRVPSPIGPTIGIVGALILGQAAVQANIISPLVIIIVALGGLTSFAINDVNLNYTVRLMKFIFIFAAGILGVYGLTASFILCLFYMVSIKSFGVPYLAPYTPTYRSSEDIVTRKRIGSERFRPGYLKPKDSIKKGEV